MRLKFSRSCAMSTVRCFFNRIFNVPIWNTLSQLKRKDYKITSINILERDECNMKKRWLSLAVALLMVFASIAQGLTPVLAEVEVEIGQA